MADQLERIDCVVTRAFFERGTVQNVGELKSYPAVFAHEMKAAKKVAFINTQEGAKFIADFEKQKAAEEKAAKSNQAATTTAKDK